MAGRHHPARRRAPREGRPVRRADRRHPGRAASAFAALEKDPANARAGREAVRELGRIAGYVEDIVRALEDHLDGRKLAGVKRRLELLAEKEPMRAAARKADAQRVERLLEAEGYFRALADGLRT